MTGETRSEEDARLARLARHSFCRGLTHAQLAFLADSALTCRFEPGEIIFREGEAADRFYLIESGAIALESGQADGPPVVVETIGSGDVLGWSWMMPPYVWHFTARAVQPGEALRFVGSVLREYCQHDHSLGFELHRRMSAVMMKRLQAARKKMLSVQAHGDQLPPAIGLPPYLEQELDEGDDEAREPKFREGAG